MEKTIVLVTGVSTGLGRAFAKALLEVGYVVVGTVREQEAVQEFESIEAERAFARVLDVTNGKRVVEVATEIESKIGPIYTLIQRWIRARGNSRRVSAGRASSAIRSECARGGGHDQSHPAVHAEAEDGPHHQCDLDGRADDDAGHILLPRQQNRAEGISSSLGKEVKSFGIRVYRVGARYVSNRLSRSLDGSFGAADFGLQRDFQSHPRSPHRAQRKSTR
jgi:hypothetical protein